MKPLNFASAQNKLSKIIEILIVFERKHRPLAEGVKSLICVFINRIECVAAWRQRPVFTRYKLKFATFRGNVVETVRSRRFPSPELKSGLISKGSSIISVSVPHQILHAILHNQSTHELEHIHASRWSETKWLFISCSEIIQNRLDR